MTIVLKLIALLFIAWKCFILPSSVEARLVQLEVDALREIVTTMGSKYWLFDAENCTIKQLGLSSVPPEKAESNITCFCINGSKTECHVTSIIIKSYDLNGTLPHQLVKLPYLTSIDFAYNFLNGSIPLEWSSTNLSYISLMVNRVSGKIPEDFGNIISLSYLNLESNQLSGFVPSEFGNLVNLETLILSSNFFNGTLPESLGKLRNITDFRINDNNLEGSIPSFIQNWKKLKRLELHASGLEGPIPRNISLLNSLEHLRISDISGPSQEFPDLRDMGNLMNLILKSCNIVGEIPSYIWNIDSLKMVDLSFNQLDGAIPSTVRGKHLKFVFLTGNLLSGEIPDYLLQDGIKVDVSYNNLTYQDPAHPACRNWNRNINLYRSSSYLNTLDRPRVPCLISDSCPRYSHCLNVDCGGDSKHVTENGLSFEGDGEVSDGTSTLYLNSKNLWGFSSTGDYMDDFGYQTIYIDHVDSANISGLYSTARKAPITLSYFHRCLANGKYDVILYFAELKFTNDDSYTSLGKRFFDIYIQGNLVKKNFNILDEARRAQTPFTLDIKDVNVTNNFLEVRLYFAGKGTTRIPERGVYGPIISGLSVISQSKACYAKGKRKPYAIVGAVLGGVSFVCLFVGLLLWTRNKKKDCDFDVSSGTFSLKQIKSATNNFASGNKIGEGGFGPVYKGVLSDGTVVAVKQLSSKSKQGNKEFLNEIAMISCLKHPNLVKLHGFCVENEQLLLVYEYMENNSLSRALFGKGGPKLDLDWPKRHKICIGIARGLAFLHEESRLKILHRDIKATNVLLDKNLNPKISDFGLARLNDEGKTHVSTKVVGTIGYMAPEYALWGHLTYKADVYSFGVVTLEVISGKTNSDCMPDQNCFCLLDKACHLQRNGCLVDILDECFEGEIDRGEALKVANVALLCANSSPKLRPTMSEVVAMLEGAMDVPHFVPLEIYDEDVTFNTLIDLQMNHSDPSTTKTSTTVASLSSLDASLVESNRSLTG